MEDIALIYTSYGEDIALIYTSYGEDIALIYTSYGKHSFDMDELWKT